MSATKQEQQYYYMRPGAAPRLDSRSPLLDEMAPPLTQQQGALGAVARFWQRSYAPDYVGIVLLELAYELVGWISLQGLRVVAYC